MVHFLEDLLCSLLQVGSETGGRYEQHHTHEEGHHRGSVLSSVSLEVLGGQHAVESEKLVGQPGGLHLPRPDPDVIGLPDGING